MTTSGGQLRCRGLSVRAGDVPLLSGVDLDVPGGSILAVLGPSGAGKTTLLRAVAGLASARGRVEVGGRDVGRSPAHRRPVGLVFQEPRLFPGLDVADNVGFALRIAGVGRRARQRRAGALLAEVGLQGFGDRRIHDLSGGEQQRVALARALAADPQVLLLDEPLSAVDAERRSELRALIRATQRARHLTMVYVTHDRSEAAALGDAVAVLVDGRVVQVGSPVAVFQRPASVAVARLVGVSNLLDVDVRGGAAAVNGSRFPVGGPDGPATLAIRPEQVRLDGTSGWRMLVADVAYLGSHTQLRLTGHGLTLQAHVPVGSAPSVDADVGVVLPPEHVWRIPGSEPTRG